MRRYELIEFVKRNKENFLMNDRGLLWKVLYQKPRWNIYTYNKEKQDWNTASRTLLDTTLLYEILRMGMRAVTYEEAFVEMLVKI